MKPHMFALLTACALSLTCTLAQAEIAPDLDLNVGLLSMVGGNFLNQPSDLNVAPGVPVRLVYPGFAGLAGGGGISAQIRWRKFLALETNLFLSSDHGFAYIDLVRVEIGQSAWHLPLMAKAYYPFETVLPYIMLGVEFVQPVTLRANTAPLLPPGATRIGSRAGSYMHILMGLGIEIKLPIQDVDLRIPIGLRMGINPSTPDAARERADYTIRPGPPFEVDTVIFSSEWQYQVHATLGLSIHL